jgi:hypothetical protein
MLSQIRRHLGWLMTKAPSFKSAQLPLLISFLALAASARSCSVASDAYNLSARQYGQERRLILKGSFAGNNGEISEIRVEPVDSSMSFLGGTAVFPKSIYEYDVPIKSNGEFFFVKSLELALHDNISKTLAKKQIHKPPGSAAASFGGWIPLIIQSAYAAKNEPYSDRSLYRLGVDWVDSDNKAEPPRLYPTGLVFVKRIPASVNLTHEYLESLSVKGFGVQYESP